MSQSLCGHKLKFDKSTPKILRNFLSLAMSVGPIHNIQRQMFAVIEYCVIFEVPQFVDGLLSGRVTTAPDSTQGHALETDRILILHAAGASANVVSTTKIYEMMLNVSRKLRFV
jgi:hypothetical protein